MASEGRGRLYRREDGTYMIYVPVDVAEDSMFPVKDFQKTIRGGHSAPVFIRFNIGGKNLTIEKWQGPDPEKDEPDDFLRRQ